MNPVDDTRLYTIGELARRTGLPVKTIRFYSDTGVVPPTDRTNTGYRLYDVEAVSRLELVRTLRELGAGLEEIRGVLGRKTTLHELASAQLALLDEQVRLLHTRRAVLRAVVAEKSTSEEVRLMNKIAQMSDDERNRLIDEFWDDVTEGLNVNPEFMAWMRQAKPNLPDTPSTAQVEAWIELAEMVRDPSFRQAVRKASEEQARQRDTGGDQDWTPENAQRGWALFEEVERAWQAGEDPASEHGRALADTFISQASSWRRSADSPQLRRQLADELADHDPRLSRYWELLAVINGWEQVGTTRPEAVRWLADALRASAG